MSKLDYGNKVLLNVFVLLYVPLCWTWFMAPKFIETWWTYFNKWVQATFKQI